MIKDKTDLLDPLAESDLSDYEKKVVEDAQNAGKGLESTDSTSGNKHPAAKQDTGIIEQTVNSKAVAGFGQPGGDSDISGGVANLDETTDATVKQNEYNR
jgi:hypothetical protein